MLRLNAYQLKWIAIIGMILNHIVFAWWENLPIGLAIPLYAAGGLTFPIMSYFVVEGYRHTSNLKKYILRLLIFGIIAVPFHVLTFRMVSLNIMFTIVVGLISLVLYDKIKFRPLFWLLFVVLCVLTILPVPFDWSIIGPIVVILTHAIKDESKRRVVPSIVAGVFILVITLITVATFDSLYEYTVDGPGAYREFHLVSLSFLAGCIVAAVLLKNFNGERGKRMKWLFYGFYPLHLAVLGGVALAMGLVELDVLRFWL